MHPTRSISRYIHYAKSVEMTFTLEANPRKSCMENAHTHI